MTLGLRRYSAAEVNWTNGTGCIRSLKFWNLQMHCTTTDHVQLEGPGPTPKNRFKVLQTIGFATNLRARKYNF